MRTIGYKHRGPLRDHTSFCDYCGVAWLRSELIGPDDDGYYRCPDDAEGRSVKTLDYIRALNASEPHEVMGVRERPGETPTNVTLVGWAWVKAGTGERIAGTLQTSKVASIIKVNMGGRPEWTEFDPTDTGTIIIDETFATLYKVEGAKFSTVVAFPYDPSPFTTAPTEPRFYYAGQLDESSALVRGRNHDGLPDIQPEPGLGIGAWAVFFYAKTGGRGVLDEVAWAWVDGTTSEIRDSEGDITIEHLSPGNWRATLNSGTYKVAQAVQFVPYTQMLTNGPHFVWASKETTSKAIIRCANSGGFAFDGNDFVIRFYR